MTTPTAGPVLGLAPEHVGEWLPLLAFFGSALAVSIPVLYPLAAPPPHHPLRARAPGRSDPPSPSGPSP